VQLCVARVPLTEEMKRLTAQGFALEKLQQTEQKAVIITQHQ
jgi:hypothetical protein